MSEVQLGPDAERRVVGELGSIPDIYANSIAVYTSGYDVTLRIMREAPDLGEKGIERQVVAQIRLSHGMAWVVSHLIQEGLRNLVKGAGPFVVPQDTLERLKLGPVFDEFIERARQ